MKKLVLLLSYLLTIVACTTANHPQPTSSLPGNDSGAGKDGSSPAVIGGWAPAFFTEFDSDKLDDIAQGINQHSIKRAVISYPTKMQGLANEIHDYLESATAQNIPLKSIELKDTDQVKYDLTQVIITLYFN